MNSYLRISQDLRRNYFIRTKGLSRINKGCQDLAGLLAFTCEVRQQADRIAAGEWKQSILDKDEGNGLCIPNGILIGVFGT